VETGHQSPVLGPRIGATDPVDGSRWMAVGGEGSTFTSKMKVKSFVVRSFILRVR